MVISSKIPQYITNNIYQNDPHYKLYPNVEKPITEMMWLISIIQFWFKIIFKNKNMSDHKNHMLIV